MLSVGQYKRAMPWPGVACPLNNSPTQLAFGLLRLSSDNDPTFEPWLQPCSARYLLLCSLSSLANHVQRSISMFNSPSSAAAGGGGTAGARKRDKATEKMMKDRRNEDEGGEGKTVEADKEGCTMM
jgi:hypothetical protein